MDRNNHFHQDQHGDKIHPCSYKFFQSYDSRIFYTVDKILSKKLNQKAVEIFRSGTNDNLMRCDFIPRKSLNSGRLHYEEAGCRRKAGWSSIEYGYRLTHFAQTSSDSKWKNSTVGLIAGKIGKVRGTGNTSRVIKQICICTCFRACIWICHHINIWSHKSQRFGIE